MRTGAEEKAFLTGGRGTDTAEQRWSAYQYLGTSGSLIPTASIIGADVSLAEIRSAPAPSNYHPPSLNTPFIQSNEPDPSENTPFYQPPFGSGFGTEIQRQVFDEVEIRELLIDHVGHRFCWGSRPARTWRISAVEDCNVYVGTLETFIEERETVTERGPYSPGTGVDGKDINAPELGLWELDLRSQFPVLFTPHKVSRAEVPHSQYLEICSGCEGRGDIVCSTCNGDQEPGFYRENQTTECPVCFGRGLIAHGDGSDTVCSRCNGKGKMACRTCGSRGLIKCGTCRGSGSMLARNIVVVTWRTLSGRKVRATRGAASVPDEVFDRAKGVQLCNTQAYRCGPAFFADSYFLNSFSSEVIAERAEVPADARVVCERHAVFVVPVTRVTMVGPRGRSFSFYIVGLGRDVYLKDYYPSRFCWGLCPCLEWLRS